MMLNIYSCDVVMCYTLSLPNHPCSCDTCTNDTLVNMIFLCLNMIFLCKHYTIVCLNMILLYERDIRDIRDIHTWNSLLKNGDKMSLDLRSTIV